MIFGDVLYFFLACYLRKFVICFSGIFVWSEVVAGERHD